MRRRLGMWVLGLGLGGGLASAEVFNGDPGNYRTLLNGLQAGDTLQLQADTYTQGLPIVDRMGEAGRPIVITGPASGAPALFLGSSVRNTISITRSGYVTIRNLKLDGRHLEGDGVKAEGTAGNFAHHITLEGLTIEDHDENQEIVGISTKCPAWDWVIRGNIIRRCGTGMYLGNSDGTQPFVNGLIEYNLIVDTTGYNAQVKHQIDRPSLPGLPRSGTTIVRHNVFSKLNGGSGGDDARPCLLVGHWPLSGDGATDVYQIYGNFFWQNPTEALFQGEGNVALYDNLFVQDAGDAVNIQPHNDVPRSVRVFHNTVLAGGRGIKVSGGNTSFQQKVIGNAVFAANPIQASDQQDNVTGSRAAAASFLVRPSGPLGMLDLYPLSGTLTGAPVDTSLLQSFTDWDRDFNAALHPATFRGAYGGEGANPGWKPQLEIKPAGGGPAPTATPTQIAGAPTATATVFPPVPTPASSGVFGSGLWLFLGLLGVESARARRGRSGRSPLAGR